MQCVAGEEESLMKRQRAAGETDGKCSERTLTGASGTRCGLSRREFGERLPHVSAANAKNLDVNAGMKRWKRKVARFGLRVNMRKKPLQQNGCFRVSRAGGKRAA